MNSKFDTGEISTTDFPSNFVEADPSAHCKLTDHPVTKKRLNVFLSLFCLQQEKKKIEKTEHSQTN